MSADSGLLEAIAHASEQLADCLVAYEELSKQCDVYRLAVEELRCELNMRDAQLAASRATVDEYLAVVGTVVELLGHSGDSPEDLTDAVGQLVALVRAGDDLERRDLQGLAEDVRQLAIRARE